MLGDSRPSSCMQVSHLFFFPYLSSSSHLVFLEILVSLSLGDSTIFFEKRDLKRVIAWKTIGHWRFWLWKSSSSNSLIKFSIRTQPSSICIFYSLYVVEFRGCLLGVVSIFLIGLFADHDGWDWGHASWIGVYWLLDRCSLLLVGEKFLKSILQAHPLLMI